MRQRTAYLVDFDGTITVGDLSSRLAHYFAGEAYFKIEESYHDGEIPIKVWLQEMAKLLPADMKLLTDMVLQWAVIRPGFEHFLDYAADHERPVVVASDGFGFYIEPILQKFDLLGKITRIYRNETFLGSSNVLTVENPHAHRICPVCGNCKAAHVVRLKEEGYAVSYIADGSNDRFGASWSDLIFARDELVETCREYKLKYMQWDDFYDIIKADGPVQKDRSENALCLPGSSGIIT